MGGGSRGGCLGEQGRVGWVEKRLQPRDAPPHGPASARRPPVVPAAPPGGPGPGLPSALWWRSNRLPARAGDSHRVPERRRHTPRHSPDVEQALLELRRHEHHVADVYADEGIPQLAGGADEPALGLSLVRIPDDSLHVVARRARREISHLRPSDRGAAPFQIALFVFALPPGTDGPCGHARTSVRSLPSSPAMVPGIMER